VEPQGFAPESFISVYLEADTKEDITLSFRITLRCDKEKGNSRTRECLECLECFEHFSTGVSSRGSYSLIRRCEITSTSGFLDEDGILHVKTQVQVFCMKLRVVETSTLQNHQGLGLMNMDSKTFCARGRVGIRTGAFPNYSGVFPHENFFSNIF
jgi:hypothetical protein